MFCEISKGQPFHRIWLVAAGSAVVYTTIVSGLCFYYLYQKSSYFKWYRKSNKDYPAPEKVREEMFQMYKGCLFSSIPPCVGLVLVSNGYSKGYCGEAAHSFATEALLQLAFWLFLEFYEFFYHYTTHTNQTFWGFHKFHHTFFNPSPFAVIADEVVDQLIRSCPTMIFPFFVPLNFDVMLFQMFGIHYLYGTYLHCGHELISIDAHNPIFNTSFQHYLHHAVSVANKPYHCGFFLKIFDQLWGSTWKNKCFCVRCEREKGNRSYDKWLQIKKPNYGSMLTPSFWWEGLKIEGKKLFDLEFIRFR